MNMCAVHLGTNTIQTQLAMDVLEDQHVEIVQYFEISALVFLLISSSLLQTNPPPPSHPPCRYILISP